MISQRLSAPRMRALLGSVAAGIGVLLAGTVYAAPVVVTYNPAAALLSGTQFTADKLNVLDFARVDLTGPATGGGTNFVESGFLQLVTTSLNNVTTTPTGLNSTYSLYYSFSGTGVQNASNFNTASTGTFSTLTYQLLGANGTTAFGINGANQPFATGAATTIIATGSLISGSTSFLVNAPGSCNNTSGICDSPGASVAATVVKVIPTFYLSPTGTFQLNAAFNNDANIVNVIPPGAFTLNGGGGDATVGLVPVPEPSTMAVLGFGLLGLGLAYRKRQSR